MSEFVSSSARYAPWHPNSKVTLALRVVSGMRSRAWHHTDRCLPWRRRRKSPRTSMVEGKKRDQRLSRELRHLEFSEPGTKMVSTQTPCRALALALAVGAG
jgi:hypothetical protein